MKAPVIPDNEDARMAELGKLDIVYSPAEERFDRITRLARRVFNVPVALVSLIYEDVQWFKSNQGLLQSESPREVSFCGHAILGNDTFVVPDAASHPDFSDNPLVIGEPFVRFYAGQPIKFGGYNLGTLCVIDQQPRELSPSDFDSLRSLACWVETELKYDMFSKSQLELISKVNTLERKSLINSVTGTWNQRGIEDVLARELSRSSRERDQTTVMLVQVNSLDEDQDAHINAAVKKEVAQRVRSSIRPYDSVGTYDDNYFLIVLINCNVETAEIIAQRILRFVTIEKIIAGDLKISPSINIGSLTNQNSENYFMEKIIKGARSALRQSLALGDNQLYAVDND